MKEDYLWDKTGAEDPEIERLETLLKAFRYQETAPPALLRRQIPVLTKPRARKISRFALAAAACTVLTLIAAGVWLQISSNKTKVENDLTAARETQKNAAFPIGSNVEQPNVSDDSTGAKVSRARNVKNSKQSAERKTIKSRQTASSLRRAAATRQTAAIAKPDVKLTPKEKYAYDQLMLALSITGSKLKLVKDKVEGMEE